MSNNQTASSRDAYYDNLRLFLMFIVVACHCLETMRGVSKTIVNLHETFLTFVMPLFVFITGFFAKSMAKAGSPKRMRILNFIVLYIVVQFLKMAIGGYDSFMKPTYGNWYLIAIVAWYLVLPLAAQIKPAILLPLSIIAAMLLGMDKYANTVLQTQRVVCFFPYFMLGYYLKKDHLEILKKPVVRLSGAFILLGGILFCLTVWNDLVPHTLMHTSATYEQMKLTAGEGLLLRLACFALSVVMSFGVMCVIPRRHFPFTVLGTRTLPIYIVHTCVYLYLTRKTDFFALLGGIQNGYLQLLAVLLLSVVTTLICGCKPFGKLFDKIMGYDFHHILLK